MSFVSTFVDTNSMTDNIIDRDNLQDAYINEIIDGMDIKDLMRIVYDNLESNLEQYSVDELIEEVEEYYPHLLEESNTNWSGCLTSWISVTRFWHDPQNHVL